MDGDLFQRCLSECIVFDGRYGFRNIDLCQQIAALECLGTEGIQSAAQLHRGKRGAALECAVVGCGTVRIRCDLGDRIRDNNGFQGGAALERIVADGGDAIAELQIRKARAAAEGCHANRCGLADGYTLQRRAFLKGALTDLGDRIRNGDLRELFTFQERTFADLGKVFLDHELGSVLAAVECAILDHRHGLRQIDLRQCGASSECVRADGLDAVLDRNSLEEVTALECLSTQCCHAAADNDLAQAGAVLERTVVRSHTIRILSDGCHGIRDHQGFQGGAVLECLIVNRGDAFAERQLLQARTAGECTDADCCCLADLGGADACACRKGAVTDLGHAVRYSQLRQSTAIIERLLTNGIDTVRDGQRCGAAAAGECACTDGIRAVRDGDFLEHCAAQECIVTDGGNAALEGDSLQMAAGSECLGAQRGQTLADDDLLEVGAALECAVVGIRSVCVLTDHRDAVRDGQLGDAGLCLEGIAGNAGNRYAVDLRRNHILTLDRDGTLGDLDVIILFIKLVGQLVLLNGDSTGCGHGCHEMRNDLRGYHTGGAGDDRKCCDYSECLFEIHDNPSWLSSCDAGRPDVKSDAVCHKPFSTYYSKS